MPISFFLIQIKRSLLIKVTIGLLFINKPYDNRFIEDP